MSGEILISHGVDGAFWMLHAAVVVAILAALRMNPTFVMSAFVATGAVLLVVGSYALALVAGR